MKNPFGVPPTLFLKRKESIYAIECNPDKGPSFGNGYSDIGIGENCNEDNNCSINNDGKRGYECHPLYKSSLFVNDAKPHNINLFTLLDYEVFGIDICKEYVDNVCKYPDIIWNYIKTKDIPEESLKLISSEDEIRTDLNLIQCKDQLIQSKISRYYLKNPSEFLPTTQIIEKEYDSYLRDWIGNYDMKLIYRASEHEYTGRSFHEYCDDKGSTLVIIKSSEGWLFGGYTTQSWSGDCIYYDMIK